MRTKALLYRIGTVVLLAGTVACLVTGLVYGISGLVLGGVVLLLATSMTSYFATVEGRRERI